MESHSLFTQSFNTADCYDLSQTPSVSTNSTRSGNRGPGRNLDRLLSTVGGRLESSIIDAVALRLRSRARQVVYSETSHAQAIRESSGNVRLHRIRSNETLGDAESDISTTATLSNLPGPGRNLDKLFGFLGLTLESLLSSLAHRSGWGPSAAQGRIIVEMTRHSGRGRTKEWKLHPSSSELLNALELEKTWPSMDHLSKKRAKKIRKYCKKLLVWTHSSSENNQMLALRHILDLASIWPDLHAVFRADYGLCILSTLPKLLTSRLCEHGELLTSSRRALFSIEENGVNNLAKKMITADYTKIDQEEGWNWFEHYLLLSLSLLWDADLSFLSLRYLGHPLLLRMAKSQIDREKVAELIGTTLIYALTQDELVGRFELDVFTRVLDETCLATFVSWELMSKTMADLLRSRLLARGVDVPSLRNHTIESDGVEWLGSMWQSFLNHLQGDDTMSSHTIIQFARRLNRTTLSSDSDGFATVFRELSLMEVELQNTSSSA